MKKTLIILAMIFAGFSASAQTVLQTSGVPHNIADSYLSAADSMHTIGIVNMQNGIAVADSFQIQCETADSLNIRYYVVPLQDLATETVADSVAGCGFVTNVATGGYQFTTDGMALVPWHNIVAAITQTRTGAKLYRIYARVYVVGSEVASSGKKFKTTVRTYF